MVAMLAKLVRSMLPTVSGAMSSAVSVGMSLMSRVNVSSPSLDSMLMSLSSIEAAFEILAQ
jgi:hypothetical protein